MVVSHSTLSFERIIMIQHLLVYEIRLYMKKLEKGFYIAEPHEKSYRRSKTLQHWFLSTKVCTDSESKPVVYYDESAKLLEILSVIKIKPYSFFRFCLRPIWF